MSRLVAAALIVLMSASAVDTTSAQSFRARRQNESRSAEKSSAGNPPDQQTGKTTEETPDDKSDRRSSDPSSSDGSKKESSPRNATRDDNSANSGGFARETLTLKDGRVYRGLMLSGSEAVGESEFVEIGLPRGRPMYLIRLSIDPRSIVSYESLHEPARDELAERIRPLLEAGRYALIEARRAEDVELRRVADAEPIDGGERNPAEGTEGSAESWVADTPHFRMIASSDETTARRCVVHLEQVFRAYRRILPPRREPDSPLTIRVFGSIDDYRRHIAARGLDIRNPAYYESAANIIVAGGDLTFFARRLRETHDRNEEVRREYERLDDGLTMRLAALADELKQAGFDRDSIQREVGARRAAWRNELAEANGRIDDAQRRNEARFDIATRQMFSRLRHEAFHAYVQNHLFAEPESLLPRWLNEGLAQVFETAQLDENRLRIDAPDADRLRRLQAELRRGDRLPLERLIDAPAGSFVATHDGSSAERNYLVAWGVAFYLAFQHGSLDPARLAEYARPPAADEGSPLDRFERLVGLPMNEFEPAWRGAMLDMRAAR